MLVQKVIGYITLISLKIVTKTTFGDLALNILVFKKNNVYHKSKNFILIF